MQIVWHERGFDELTARELYAIVELRERVFVVEQRCVYLDADGLDRFSHHVFATRGDAVVAYLRIVAAGAKHAERSIGRVVVAPEVRGTGLGRELVRRGHEPGDARRGVRRDRRGVAHALSAERPAHAGHRERDEREEDDAVQVDPPEQRAVGAPEVLVRPAHPGSPASTYPAPRTVLMSLGRLGSSPSFWRRRETWTSTERSKASSALPRASSMSCSRARIRPGRRARARRSASPEK